MKEALTEGVRTGILVFCVNTLLMKLIIKNIFVSVITRNCAEVLVYFPQAPSGIYTIHPIPGTPVEVINLNKIRRM